MPIDIGAIVTSSLISTALGRLIEACLPRQVSAPDRTLDTFLRTLSTEFTQRVESVVRAAFTDQNFLQVKANIGAAALATRAYALSRGQDPFQLDAATSRIMDASSLLMVEGERALSFNGSTLTSDPVQRSSLVLQHIRVLEATMEALQSIAALDLLILSARAERFPNLNAVVIERVDLYENFAQRLQTAYLTAQTFRKVIKDSFSVAPIPTGEYYAYVTLNSGVVYYRDDAVVQTHAKCHSRIFDRLDRPVIDQAHQSYRGEIERLYSQDDTFTRPAQERINLFNQQAMVHWQAVRETFRQLNN